jgi:alkaline phosphatase
MKKIYIFLTISILSISIGFAQSNPKNIIIVTVNGMGFNHVQALESYEGTENVWENFPTQYGVTTYPAYSQVITDTKDAQYYTGDYHNRRIWSDSAYVDNMITDPASAGTAIATGVKSAYKSVGVDLDSTALETILERAFTIGKSTGIITDLAIPQSGAASFAAHVPSSDDTLSVLAGLLQSQLSLIIGAGHPYYSNNGEARDGNFSYFPSSIWQALDNGLTDYGSGISATDINNDGIADAWSLIRSSLEIDSMANRLLIVPEMSDAIQFKRSATEPISFVPELSELSIRGINHLNTDPDGFVLLVESGAVDYASRNNDAEGVITAMQTVHETVQSISDWVETNSSWDETMIVVTGTYETGFITGPDFDANQRHPEYYTQTVAIENGTAGELPDMIFQSEYPTRFATPLYAKGVGSDEFSNYIDQEDFVYGHIINNSEIGQACFRLLPDPATTITKPKNIILMINDGMGYNHMKIGEYYTGERQQYQDFPVALGMSTYPLATNENTDEVRHWNNSYESRLAWTDTKYLWGRNNVTCSAASGTAIASGTKTYYYCLGVDKEGNALNTIARHAKGIDKSVGIVTTKSIYDATPASFYANNVSRLEYEDISRQLIIESDIDVLIGANHPEYSENAQLMSSGDYDNIGGEEFWDDLTNNALTYSIPTKSGWTDVQDCTGDGIPDPWTLIEDSADFAYFMEHDTLDRMLGLMKVGYSSQIRRTGIDNQTVHFDDWNQNVPELWQTSRAALRHLQSNTNGFFAMFEGGATDNAGHWNYKGRLVEEQIVFDRAVDSVIHWIEQNGGWEENLLIVTADHETGIIAHPDFGTDSIMLNHYQIGDNGPWNMPYFSFFAGDHSNQLVPFFAKGAGSEIFNSYADEQDIVRGKFITNSEIGQALFYLWDGKPCTIINHKPVFISDPPLEDVYLTKGVDTSFTVPTNFVTDREDTEFTFTLTSRPSWLSYNDTTMTFTGTPQGVGRARIGFDISDGKNEGAGVSISTLFYVVVSSNTSLESPIQETAAAYPNPAETQVVVSLKSGAGSIRMYNAEGKKIYEAYSNEEKHIIPVSHLKPGVYNIHIQENNIRTQQHIIIQ